MQALGCSVWVGGGQGWPVRSQPVVRHPPWPAPGRQRRGMGAVGGGVGVRFRERETWGSHRETEGEARRDSGTGTRGRRQRLCGAAGGLVRAARVSEQVNGEEPGGRWGHPVLSAPGREGRRPGGKDLGTGSGKGTGRGAERCQVGGKGGWQVSALTPVRLSARPPRAVPRVCPGLSAGLAPPWTVAASPTCSSPRLPCRLSGPLVTGLAPPPTPALRPSQRPLPVSPSRVSVRVS